MKETTLFEQPRYQTAVSHWVLIIEARSTAPADDFLARLTEKWTARGGAAATAQSYEGVDLTVFPDLALGRNGRLLLISSDVATMQQSIDAKNGRCPWIRPCGHQLISG